MQFTKALDQLATVASEAHKQYTEWCLRADTERGIDGFEWVEVCLSAALRNRHTKTQSGFGRPGMRGEMNRAQTLIAAIEYDMRQYFRTSVQLRA